MYEDRKGDWIQTFTGKRFYPLDPRPEDFDIIDIAHALSLTTRFGGHCINFYSVAEHSFLIGSQMYDDLKNPDEALAGLLHDASEAYLGDIPKPLKQLLPEYLKIEHNVQTVIMKKFTKYDFIPAIVKEYDKKILMNEKLQNMNESQAKWKTDNEGLDIECLFLHPEEAKYQFLAIYDFLNKEK